MSNFDFENYNLIGCVDILPNGNANIKALGYVNYSNDLHILTSRESLEMFPPKGRVFAHNFNQHYNMLDKLLVCLAVVPNEKKGDNLDAYVWDKSSVVYEFGSHVYPINASVNDDGENNFTIFQENDLIETDDDKYVLSGDKILYIKANSKERLIPYWETSNVNIIETQFGRKYLYSAQLPERDGVIDITNDDQLINWFITKILKKHWTEIKAADSYKSVEQYLFTAFNDMKHLTPNVYKNRLDRLKRLNANFAMTLDELSNIAEIPWVKKVIEKTVDEYKTTLINDTSAEYKRQLDKVKDDYNELLKKEKDRYDGAVKQQREHYNHTLQSIADNEAKISATLDEKKLELEILDESIVSKNDKIAKINELLNRANIRKDDLLSDFAIIKDVLEFGPRTGTAQSKKAETKTYANLNIQFINMADSECMMFEAYGKSLEEMLKFNKLPYQNATTIAETLAAYKTLIVPDVAYAISIIHATQKCYYAVEYVNVTWKSFEDLWKEGLYDMVDHCKQESDVMHYLVLQNINLTYLPNFMQPLIDIQMGIVNCFPFGEQFPDNLRILCTIANEEVIPMSEQCVKYMGCIEKPSKDIYVGRFNVQYDARYGYLTPSKLSEKALANPANFYKMYINE